MAAPQEVKGLVEGPLGHSPVTWVMVISFAVLGGLVKWFNEYQKSNTWDRRMIAVTFAAQVFTSGFVGIITFLACNYFQLSDTITAVFIGVSGHMGAEAINVFQAGFSGFFQRGFTTITPKPQEGGQDGKTG